MRLSLLLPQCESPTEDVNPGHKREGCQFKLQLFQEPELDMGKRAWTPMLR